MRILNVHKDDIPKGAINIMRGKGTQLGNPFVIGPDGDRDEVCAKFEIYAIGRVRRDEKFRQEIEDCYGKDLVCCCAPQKCHGLTIKKLATALKNGEKV